MPSKIIFALQRSVAVLNSIQFGLAIVFVALLVPLPLDAATPWDPSSCPKVELPAAGTWVLPPSNSKKMVECSRRLVSQRPREWLGEIFVNSFNGLGMPPEQWHQIDITERSGGAVPRSAKAVFLSGVILITNVGQGAPTLFSPADLHVAFRAIGDQTTTLTCNYGGQTATNVANEGTRSGYSTWVPLTDGKVEFAWWASTFNGLGTLPSYGINLSVQEACE